MLFNAFYQVLSRSKLQNSAADNANRTEITQEVNTRIERLKKRKADGIHNELINYEGPTLHTWLLKLFKKLIITTGRISEEWKDYCRYLRRATEKTQNYRAINEKHSETTNRNNKRQIRHSRKTTRF